MSDIMQSIRNRIFFSRRDARLEQRVRNEFIDNGIAVIPCHVTGYHDIISSYSVRGYETLNPEFTGYIESTAEFLPSEYPVVLEISGTAFTPEEQEKIRTTIREDFYYDLGAVQEENRRERTVALVMMIGMLLSGFIVFFISGLPSVSVEFLYIFFWFFADIFVSYVFLDNPGNIEKRIRAGRLASMTVTFSEEHDDSEVTDEDVRLVYEDMHRQA